MDPAAPKRLRYFLEREGHPAKQRTLAIFWGVLRGIALRDVLIFFALYLLAVPMLKVVGAAKGGVGLVVFGLLVSVPIIVWGSRLVLKLMDNFPIVIAFGGALLGWIAGDMVATDVLLRSWVEGNVPAAHWTTPALGALLVIGLGKRIGARRLRERGHVSTDLAGEQPAQARAQQGENR